MAHLPRLHDWPSARFFQPLDYIVIRRRGETFQDFIERVIDSHILGPARLRSWTEEGLL